MLNWPKYSFEQAAQDMTILTTNNMIEVQLDNYFSFLRNQLIKSRDEIFEKYYFDNGINDRYLFDLEFGLSLYEILDDHVDNRLVSMDDIWRYLSIKVIPDVVHARHGLNEDYYYKRSRRIYLKQLWWYIHLGWTSNREKTFKLLENNSTDTIQALVERPGLGYNIEVYREILRQYYQYNHLDRHILRRVMKLNTAKIRLLSPELLSGGVTQFVDELYTEVLRE